MTLLKNFLSLAETQKTKRRWTETNDWKLYDVKGRLKTNKNEKFANKTRTDLKKICFVRVLQ